METIIPRMVTFSNSSFFLFGPRGTGKSTLLKNTVKNALWFDLLDADVFQNLAARPERLTERINAEPKIRKVIIDEIQKLPELLDVVHRLMEERKELLFILTGSSARKLKRTGTDLLAGRAIMKSLHPFMAAELGEKFNFENTLNIGLLPIILFHPNPGQALRTYVSLYLKEEVQQEGLTRNFSNFVRFLETASFSHAAVLNVSNMARECGVDRKTTEGYISILEDLLLAFRVPVFTKRAVRGLAAHDKFFFFDTGVYRTLRPHGPLDRVSEIDGAALEGLVAQHLYAWCGYREDDSRLYYWRTRGGLEVDFIVYGPSAFSAIEVKNSRKVSSRDLRSLKEFRRDYPEAGCVLVYRGKDRLLIDNILCVPAGEFLANIHPDNRL
ncbi:MAG: ATP-binding protein [Spirochaetales bacterium]|nr:ATP-binding protein [Spirochaetales bacterium]